MPISTSNKGTLTSQGQRPACAGKLGEVVAMNSTLLAAYLTAGTAGLCPQVYVPRSRTDVVRRTSSLTASDRTLP